MLNVAISVSTALDYVDSFNAAIMTVTAGVTLDGQTVAQLGDGVAVKAAQVEVERGVLDVVSSGRLDDLDHAS